MFRILTNKSCLKDTVEYIGIFLVPVRNAMLWDPNPAGLIHFISL